MWISTPSNPPRWAISAESAHAAVNPRMSATLISRVAWAVDGDNMREGAYTARGPSGPSGIACAPWWFNWTKILAPASWTASVMRRSASTASGRNASSKPRIDPDGWTN